MRQLPGSRLRLSLCSFLPPTALALDSCFLLFDVPFKQPQIMPQMPESGGSPGPSANLPPPSAHLNACAAATADVLQRHVFVYGTLRRGGANDITRLSPAPRFVGHAQIEGAMHHLGAYPGLRLGTGGPVRGEVYAIGPKLEQRLDEIEMILPEPTGEYLKREVVLAVLPEPAGEGVEGLVLSCIVYEISPTHAHGRPIIASGDWIADKDA